MVGTYRGNETTDGRFSCIMARDETERVLLTESMELNH